jgi:hypothetical protein
VRLIAGAILLGFVILAATIAYLGRYETTSNAHGAALVTDRWLGTVRLCGHDMTNGAVVCISEFPPRPTRSADEILGPQPPPKP